MLTLITIVTFIILPAMISAALLTVKGKEITLLSTYQWEEEHSIWIDVLEEVDLDSEIDSYLVLKSELEGMGLSLLAMSCLPNSGRMVLYIEDAVEEELPPWELAHN